MNTGEPSSLRNSNQFLIGAFQARIVMGLKVLAAFLIALLIVPPISGGVAVATLLNVPLPIGHLPDKKPTVEALPSVVVDADGKKIATFRGFDQMVEVEASEIPQALKDAVVAIEDRRFWVHKGVDIEGIARAARTNLQVGGIAQGGSTLTHLFVKTAYLSSERTLERKVEEALLAIELEKIMTKEEILFEYMNSAYYGSGAYGIGAAAEIYFRKKVSALDISEAATLAGIIQAPTRLSPFDNLQAAEERRLLVLENMLQQGYISDGEFNFHAPRKLLIANGFGGPTVPATEVIPRIRNGALRYPFFVDYIKQDLIERFGADMVYQGGLKIETTISAKNQDAAEQAVAQRLENTEYPVEMALVSLDPTTGHVKAMVGGRDYSFSQVNLALGGSTGFQPGSSFKPIVLAAALNMGLAPDTTYPGPSTWQVPGCQGDACTIANYAHSGYGELSLRKATRYSVNTIYAQLISDLGTRSVAELAVKLGMERTDPEAIRGVSYALGVQESSPLEMANAYGVFANRGVKVEPTGLLRVLDRDGNVLIDNSRPIGERVLSTVVSDNVSDILADVVTGGTGTRAAIGRPVVGKTGTAQAYRAAWFVGYTPQLVTSVWMGHADRSASLTSINGVGWVTGGSHPAVAFSQYMQAAHEGLEVQEFPEPAQVAMVAETVEESIAKFKSRDVTVAAIQQTRTELAPTCGASGCYHKVGIDFELSPAEVPFADGSGDGVSSADGSGDGVSSADGSGDGVSSADGSGDTS